MVTMRGHTDYISCFSFYHNKIVSGSGDATLKIWNAHKYASFSNIMAITGPFRNEPIATLNGHTRPIECLQFNEVRIVSGSTDGTVRLWDVGTGLPVGDVTTGRY